MVLLKKDQHRSFSRMYAHAEVYAFVISSAVWRSCHSTALAKCPDNRQRTTNN